MSSLHQVLVGENSNNNKVYSVAEGLCNFMLLLSGEEINIIIASSGMLEIIRLRSSRRNSNKNEEYFVVEGLCDVRVVLSCEIVIA